MRRKLFLYGLCTTLLIGASAFFYVQRTGGLVLKKAINNQELQEGDMIFQSTNSRQCAAVKMVTKSDYSHCGLVFNRYNKKDDWWVLEAVQPVRWTRLKSFIARGENGHYVIKRLKNFNPSIGDSLQLAAEQYLGKNYDALFQWSDNNIYCSELVWKAYKQVLGLEIGKTQRLRDFDLSHPSVAKIVAERYGKQIPWEEKVISPQAIFESKSLELVLEH